MNTRRIVPVAAAPLAALATLAAAAHAAPIVTPGPSFTIGQPAQFGPRAADDRSAQFLIYSNFDDFSGSAISHGSAFAHDDILPDAGGVVDEFFFTIANLGNDTYTGGTAVVSFNEFSGDNFDPIGDQIGAFSVNLSSFTLGPGGIQVVIVDQLADLGINLDAGVGIFAGVSFEGGSFANNSGDLSDIGQGIFNPPAVGSSVDYVHIEGSGGTSFGGNPNANFGMQIVGIPAPGAAGLLAVLGVATRRRRRHG